MPEPDAAPLEKLSYEEALRELESLIKRLETGSVDLANSIASYERGVALAGHCSNLLEATEQKVHKLVVDRDGAPTEQPFLSAEE